MAFFSSGWFGSLIGLVGILLSLYFYFKDKIGNRLDYQMAELKILDHKNYTVGMEVKYFDKPIAKLVKTQIVIWNSGHKTIDGNNIVTSDPLRFIFDSSEVLSCNVMYFSRAINNCIAIKDEHSVNAIKFNFDFLDPKDGMVIEILHTGEEVYPKFQGSIKGMKDKIRNRGLAPYPVIENIPKRTKTIITLISLSTFLASSIIIIGLLYLYDIFGKGGVMDMKIHIGVGISLGLVISNFNLFKRRRAPKTIKPVYLMKK